jgi:NADH:ubiquinone oxidoreductase subunit 1 (chain H)
VEFINNIFTNLMDWLGNWLLTFLPYWLMRLIIDFIVIVVILGFAVVAVLFLTWMERKVVARIADRIGPNRWGPFGLFQPFADAIKMLIKGRHRSGEGRPLAVQPGACGDLDSRVAHLCGDSLRRWYVRDRFEYGILYMVALGSITMRAMLMAGWSSANKYALLGAFRSVAQLVSYEVPMVLVIVSVVMITGSLSMVKIVENQNIPYILLMPVAFVVYLCCAAAEVGRSPFDLLEADSEIVAGYFIEYSGMKFAMFFLAEYINLFAVSAICTTLFLGGWKGPILPPYIWFLIKCFAVIFVLMWFRGTWPRFRIDQMLDFAWKVLVPLALLNIFVVGVVTKVVTNEWIWLAVMLPLNVVIAIAALSLLGRAQHRRVVEAREIAARGWPQRT